MTKNHEKLQQYISEEYTHVNEHISVIYDTRDRFFGNFMTLAIAAFGLLGYILNTGIPAQKNSLIEEIIFLILSTLVVFGLGTIVLISGNWIARDYYKQRRKKLKTLLLKEIDYSDTKATIEDYTNFSRNKATWKFRVLSIYAIYIYCISFCNCIAVVICKITIFKSNYYFSSILAFLLTFLIHIILCLSYIKTYRSKEYADD